MKTGIRHAEVFPGKLNAPPHCHSAEEEIFVVLEGDGHVLLWEEDGRRGAPGPSRLGRRRGPPGTGVAHAFRGGDDGHDAAHVRDARSARRLLTTRGRARSSSSASG